MGQPYFDTSNLKTNKIAYIIIITIIIVILCRITIDQRKELTGVEIKDSNGKPINRNDITAKADGNGDIYHLARGHSSDEPNELIDRIEWASALNDKITWWHRKFIVTLIISILVIFFVLRKIPDAGTFILLLVIIFIPMYASHQLFYVHGDVYNEHYIKANAELLREKFGYVKNDPPLPKNQAPDRLHVM